VVVVVLILVVTESLITRLWKELPSQVINLLKC